MAPPIQHLTVDKKLTINDTTSAKESLSNISYYALIGGYKSLFYDPMARTYIPGTTFDDILTLYKFDESLRTLVFEYSNIIEQKLRSAISYAFCEKYTNLQSAYLDANHYQNTKRNRYSIKKLLNMFFTTINVESLYIMNISQQPCIFYYFLQRS